jgi:hypothetical protein
MFVRRAGVLKPYTFPGIRSDVQQSQVSLFDIADGDGGFA